MGLGVCKTALDVAIAGDRAIQRFPNTANGIIRMPCEHADVRIARSCPFGEKPDQHVRQRHLAINTGCALTRTSTPEEQAWLEAGGGF